jgi:hypothetical protein
VLWALREAAVSRRGVCTMRCVVRLAECRLWAPRCVEGARIELLESGKEGRKGGAPTMMCVRAASDAWRRARSGEAEEM